MDPCMLGELRIPGDCTTLPAGGDPLPAGDVASPTAARLGHEAA